MLFRTWITAVLVGTGFAWILGLNPLDPYLYEVLILGGMALLGGIIMLVAHLLGWQWLVLLAAGVTPLMMAHSEFLLQMHTKPHAVYERVTHNVPVSLNTWIDRGTIRGRITNRHPTAWLRAATVHCTPAYGDGTLSKRTKEVQVGAGGWLAPGEHTEERLVDGQGILWEPGMVLYLTSCRIAEGEFYAAPTSVPQFTYSKEDVNNHYVFTVHNDQQQALTRISFSCWVQFGDRRVKQDLVMRPFYKDGNSYIAQPGEDVVLYSTQSFAGRELLNCAAKDVTWVAPT